jgi:enoyl-CoA hydratase/carnithine racemase
MPAGVCGLEQSRCSVSRVDFRIEIAQVRQPVHRQAMFVGFASSKCVWRKRPPGTFEDRRSGSDRLLPRAREIAEQLARRPPLTSSYTRVALTQKLRRIVDEGIGYGLALEGISAAAVSRTMTAQG